MELKNALDLEDPTTYVSSLPIHQDGTCNGLQHYAALGGDAIGAQQVNLSAGDRPSDVYTHISLLVEKDIAIDAEAGNPVAQLLLGKVSRKVVKQTVPYFFLLVFHGWPFSLFSPSAFLIGYDDCIRCDFHWGP
jgi:DNA-directed RNA polymerase